MKPPGHHREQPEVPAPDFALLECFALQDWVCVYLCVFGGGKEKNGLKMYGNKKLQPSVEDDLRE